MFSGPRLHVTDRTPQTSEAWVLDIANRPPPDPDDAGAIWDTLTERTLRLKTRHLTNAFLIGSTALANGDRLLALRPLWTPGAE